MDQLPRYIRVWLTDEWIPKDKIYTKAWFYFIFNEINGIYRGFDHRYRLIIGNEDRYTIEIITEREYLEHYFSKNMVICL